MKYWLRFDERAIQEADEAYVYYETQQKGLGDRFRDELEKCIEYIQKNPNQFKKIKGEIREALVHGFPYLIVYQAISEIIIVVAVFHTSRNPREKLKKQRKPGLG